MLEVLAHEIRTPLAVVRGYAGLIERAEDLAEARRGCEAIERAATRIDTILERLTVRRVDPTPIRCPLPIGPTVAEIVKDLQQTTATELRFVQHADPTVTIAADPSQIVRGISNLISNALRFSPAGAPVEEAVRTDMHWADIEVSDEGPGVDPAHLALIFLKHGRAHPDGPGSGLGLYIARQIARAHGGTVLVRNRPAGRGASFAIRLPVRTADRDDPTRRCGGRVRTRRG